MAARIASYRLKGRRVEVWRGDAPELPASVGLFGRNRALRGRLEAIAGRPFEPSGTRTIHGRRLDLLPLASSPWRVAASIDYHPRRVSIDARQTPPHLSHIDRLSDDLFWALWLASQRADAPGPLVLLPLSCRNPEVVAVATVLAVWRILVDWLPTSPSGRPGSFRLVDLDDPGPYIHALEDRDSVVTRALHAGTPPPLRDGMLERWRRHPFVRHRDGLA